MTKWGIVFINRMFRKLYGFELRKRDGTKRLCRQQLRIYQNEVLEMPGIEPGAFHMQSERSTTEPHPRLWRFGKFYKFKKMEFIIRDKGIFDIAIFLTLIKL